MTIDHLISLLEDLKAESEDGGDTEVRIMSQQSWPFEQHIRGVVANREIASAKDDSPDCGFCGQDECADCGGVERPAPQETTDFGGGVAPATRVFLVEGGQARYGNKDAWDACHD